MVFQFIFERYLLRLGICYGVTLVKNKLKYGFVLSALVVACAANAQTYVKPSSPLGGAVAAALSASLATRGFSAFDPRVVSTVAGVSARAVAVAGNLGAGARWLGVLAASQVPYALTAGAIALVGYGVYQGIVWYLDSSGKVVTSSAPLAVVQTGTQLGAGCFYVMGGAGFCAGTPEEALTQYVLASSVYVDLTAINLVADAVGSTAYVNGRRYTASYSGHRSGDTVNVWPSISSLYVYNGTATASCPAGQGAQSGYCGPSNIDKYVPPTTTSSAQTAQAAFDALPANAKAAPMSPELVAALANRLWRDASVQAGYVGVPYSALQSVSVADASAQLNSHASDWPLTSELNSAFPTTGQPIALPTKNDNAISSPTTSTAPAISVDFGIDPGIAAPILEATPTGLFSPIQSLLTPWTNWAVPTHSASCPTWSGSPSISGVVFPITIEKHCSFVEQYRTLIYSASIACFVILAAFLILSA